MGWVEQGLIQLLWLVPPPCSLVMNSFPANCAESLLAPSAKEAAFLCCALLTNLEALVVNNDLLKLFCCWLVTWLSTFLVSFHLVRYQSFKNFGRASGLFFFGLLIKLGLGVLG